MVPNDFYFVKILDRIYFVKKTFWDQNHHIDSSLQDISQILPEGFSKDGEANFSWHKNGKKLSTKKTTKLLKDAGFTNVRL